MKYLNPFAAVAFAAVACVSPLHADSDVAKVRFQTGAPIARQTAPAAAPASAVRMVEPMRAAQPATVGRVQLKETSPAPAAMVLRPVMEAPVAAPRPKAPASASPAPAVVRATPTLAKPAATVATAPRSVITSNDFLAKPTLASAAPQPRTVAPEEKTPSVAFRIFKQTEPTVAARAVTSAAPVAQAAPIVPREPVVKEAEAPQAPVVAKSAPAVAPQAPQVTKEAPQPKAVAIAVAPSTPPAAQAALPVERRPAPVKVAVQAAPAPAPAFKFESPVDLDKIERKLPQPNVAAIVRSGPVMHDAVAEREPAAPAMLEPLAPAPVAAARVPAPTPAPIAAAPVAPAPVVAAPMAPAAQVAAPSLAETAPRQTLYPVTMTPTAKYRVPARQSVPFAGRPAAPPTTTYEPAMQAPREFQAQPIAYNEAAPAVAAVTSAEAQAPLGYTPSPLYPAAAAASAAAPKLQPITFEQVPEESLPSPSDLPAGSSLSSQVPLAQPSMQPGARFESGDLVDEGCCEPCMTECCPCATWCVRGSALFLNRSRPDGDFPLTNCNCTPPQPPFTPSDADLNNGVGYRLGICRTGPCGNTLDFQYFRVGDWSETRQFGGDINVMGVALGTGTATWQYDSDLTNFEANYKRAITPWLCGIVGFRGILLDENASLDGVGTLTGPFYYGVEANNTLLGAQIGADYTVFDNGGCFTLDAIAKVGVFNNNMQVTRDFNGVVTDQSTDEVAFAGDFELLGGWQITPHIALTAGYYLMWLDTVALAPEQFANTTAINTTGDVFIQGGTAGVNFCW